jgi:anti-sigma factor RsiW
MNCRDLCELLCEYVAGELDAALCEAIRRHLEECPPCLHYEATYRLTITLSRRLPPAEMPAETAERLRAAVCRGPQSPDDSSAV